MIIHTKAYLTKRQYKKKVIDTIFDYYFLAEVEDENEDMILALIHLLKLHYSDTEIDKIIQKKLKEL